MEFHDPGVFGEPGKGRLHDGDPAGRIFSLQAGRGELAGGVLQHIHSFPGEGKGFLDLLGGLGGVSFFLQLAGNHQVVVHQVLLQGFPGSPGGTEAG